MTTSKSIAPSRPSAVAGPRTTNPGRLRFRLPIVASALALIAIPPAFAAESAPGRRWAVVERSLGQDGGDWQVDYRIKYDPGASAPITLAPADLAVAVDGWVSNSRVPAHAVPRRSSPRVEGVTGKGTATFDMIVSPEDDHACRERVVLRAWAAGSPDPAPRAKATPPAAADPIPAVTIAPGGVLRIRVRLEHEHFLYGAFDPLLGARDLAIRLAGETLADVLPLDREHHLAQARPTWPEPPEDRRDTRHAVTGPDSLHLEAHVPGNQYLRFDERPVRYDTRMRLSFWYLIAPGGEGDFRVRVAQYRESPTSGWTILQEAATDETFAVVGRWVRVERVVQTAREATSLALDFRIHGGDVGEVWIDDVSLEPVDAAPGGP